MTRVRSSPAALRVKVRARSSSGAVHPGQQGKKAGQQHRGLAGARRGLQVEAGPGA